MAQGQAFDQRGERGSEREKKFGPILTRDDRRLVEHPDHGRRHHQGLVACLGRGSGNGDGGRDRGRRARQHGDDRAHGEVRFFVR